MVTPQPTLTMRMVKVRDLRRALADFIAQKEVRVWQ